MRLMRAPKSPSTAPRATGFPARLAGGAGCPGRPRGLSGLAAALALAVPLQAQNVPRPGRTCKTFRVSRDSAHLRCLFTLHRSAGESPVFALTTKLSLAALLPTHFCTRKPLLSSAFFDPLPPPCRLSCCSQRVVLLICPRTIWIRLAHPNWLHPKALCRIWIAARLPVPPPAALTAAAVVAKSQALLVARYSLLAEHRTRRVIHHCLTILVISLCAQLFTDVSPPPHRILSLVVERTADRRSFAYGVLALFHSPGQRLPWAEFHQALHKCPTSSSPPIHQHVPANVQRKPLCRLLFQRQKRFAGEAVSSPPLPSSPFWRRP